MQQNKTANILFIETITYLKQITHAHYSILMSYISVTKIILTNPYLNF